MAESILVFDEAHLMPINYMQQCLRAISYITQSLNREAIFIMAIMPDHERLSKEYSVESSKILNLVVDMSLFYRFTKCSYINLNECSFERLMAKAKEKPATLIIVNKKTTAREFYSLCSGQKYHLSTNMSAYDRKRVIEEIKAAICKLERDYKNLKNVPEDRRIPVISTSLIEAGVDLDFSCIFREIAGLDKIFFK